MTGRAGVTEWERAVRRAALLAVPLTMQYEEGSETRLSDRVVDTVLDALRSLPVEQRMEAMGMIEAGEVNDAGDAWVSDHSEWWPRGRYDGVPFYVEVPDA